MWLPVGYLEDYGRLWMICYHALPLPAKNWKHLTDSLMSPGRLEWLSVRVLLNEMTGKELSIYYNGNRKPFIKGNSYYISISHSRDLTSILLSREKKSGY